MELAVLDSAFPIPTAPPSIPGLPISTVPINPPPLIAPGPINPPPISAGHIAPLNPPRLILPRPFCESVTVKPPDQAGPIHMVGKKGRMKLLEVQASEPGYYDALKAQIHKRTPTGLACSCQWADGTPRIYCEHQMATPPVNEFIEPFDANGVCCLEEGPFYKVNGTKKVLCARARPSPFLFSFAGR